jgi:hypothetical protein
VSRRGALAAGAGSGLGLGLGDGLAILLENPRSFEGWGDGLGFLAASIALATAAGLAAGLLLALGLRDRSRSGPETFLIAGVAAAVFLALGVRMHVQWFFGVPLTAPTYLLANLALAVGCVGLAVGLRRLAGPFLRRELERPRALGIALTALGLSLVATAALRPESAEPVERGTPPAGARDVLLVTLDTTRADRLSVYGYPRGTTPGIDRLSRSSLLWEVTYAPIPLTNPSHSSLFTGLLPREHGVRNNGTALPDSFETFVPDLARAGWRCAAFISGIPLKSGLSGLARGFETYDDALSPLERIHPMLTSLALVRVANRALPGDLVERRARDTVAAAIDWLERTEGPRFLWVHVFDPHSPYDAPRPLRERFARESPAWTAAGRPVVEWPHADYDAEVRETDRHIEDLLRAWDVATGGAGSVILTADHGEGLEQHGELTHGAQLFEEDVRVACLWRVDDPRVRPNHVLRRPRALVEIRQGIRWAAGLEEPPARGRAAPFLVETFAPEGKRDRSAVIDADGRKLVVDRETGEELRFDLGADPEERRPVAGEGPGWDTLRERLAGSGPGSKEPLDPETLRRLRSLGYIH